jgi:hypothetical protein
MDYTNLGTSGLKVSRIALGGMSFGTPREVMPWTLDEDAAQPVFRRALDLGITFWDTANVYGAGTSEEIVRRLLDVGLAVRRPTRRSTSSVDPCGSTANKAIVDVLTRIAQEPGAPWRPSPWPGCSSTQPSTPRSSAPPNPITSPPRSTRSISNWPTTR